MEIEILGWVIGFFIGTGIFIVLEKIIPEDYKYIFFTGLGVFLIGILIGLETDRIYYKDKVTKIISQSKQSNQSKIKMEEEIKNVFKN